MMVSYSLVIKGIKWFSSLENGGGSGKFNGLLLEKLFCDLVLVQFDIKVLLRTKLCYFTINFCEFFINLNLKPVQSSILYQRPIYIHTRIKLLTQIMKKQIKELSIHPFYIKSLHNQKKEKLKTKDEKLLCFSYLLFCLNSIKTNIKCILYVVWFSQRLCNLLFPYWCFFLVFYWQFKNITTS